LLLYLESKINVCIICNHTYKRGYWAMPTKTIYMSKDDLSVFDEARKKAGGNLSPVIVKALNEYVGRHDAKEDAKAKGFTEVSVTLGSPGYERDKRFMGKRIFSTFD